MFVSSLFRRLTPQMSYRSGLVLPSLKQLIKDTDTGTTSGPLLGISSNESVTDIADFLSCTQVPKIHIFGRAMFNYSLQETFPNLTTRIWFQKGISSQTILCLVDPAPFLMNPPVKNSADVFFMDRQAMLTMNCLSKTEIFISDISKIETNYLKQIICRKTNIGVIIEI